jgi:hypothetical protein
MPSLFSVFENREGVDGAMSQKFQQPTTGYSI